MGANGWGEGAEKLEVRLTHARMTRVGDGRLRPNREKLPRIAWQTSLQINDVC
jgi:hypothetical protein